MGMTPQTPSPFKRMQFINPVTQQVQTLKIRRELVDNGPSPPIPISTKYQDKIFTMYIDKNYNIRAIDVSQYLPDLIPLSADDASISNEECLDENGDTHFKVFRNQQIESADKEKLQQSVIGKILLIGLSKAGKTSITKRIGQDLYDPNVKPTLGANIIKVFLEEMNFQIYDMGGQEKLRKQWFKRFPQFSAIIFVLDVNQSEEDWGETCKEFRHVEEYYFQDIGMSSETPLLILGNKIDKVKDSAKVKNEILKKIMNKLEVNALPVNYHVALSSASQSEGIIPSFKWLVRNYLNMRKEL